MRLNFQTLNSPNLRSLTKYTKNTLCPPINTPKIIQILPYKRAYTTITKQPTFSQFSKMGSDEDYASFLDKANQDPNSGQASTQSKTKKVSTKAVDTEVPKALEEVDEYYVSEADEPFEPVSLKWDGDGLPSAKDFSKLIGKDAESIGQKDFDPQGSYQKVIDAVKKASDGKVGYFSVEIDGTRTEYFVVGVQGGAVVGLKAVAIQS